MIVNPDSNVLMMQYSETGKKLTSKININPENVLNPKKEIISINQCFDTLLKSGSVTEDEKSLVMFGKSVIKNNSDIMEEINIGLTIINAVANPLQGPVGATLAKVILDVAQKSTHSSNALLSNGYDILLNNPNISSDERTVAKLGKLAPVISRDESISHKLSTSILGAISNKISAPEMDLLAKIAWNCARISLSDGFKAVLDHPSAKPSQKKIAEMVLSAEKSSGFDNSCADDIRAIILNVIIDDIISKGNKPEEKDNSQKTYQVSSDTEKMLREIDRKFELEISGFKQQTARLEEENRSDNALYDSIRSTMDKDIEKTGIMQKVANGSVLPFMFSLIAGPILCQAWQCSPIPFFIPFLVMCAANVVHSKMGDNLKAKLNNLKIMTKHLEERGNEIKSGEQKGKAYFEVQKEFSKYLEVYDLAKNVSKPDISESQQIISECDLNNETYININGIKVKAKDSYTPEVFYS